MKKHYYLFNFDDQQNRFLLCASKEPSSIVFCVGEDINQLLNIRDRYNDLLYVNRDQLASSSLVCEMVFIENPKNRILNDFKKE